MPSTEKPPALGAGWLFTIVRKIEMPTGENPGVGFGWGAYRNRFGGIEMKGTNIRSHSLSLENCRYLDGIAKGHKSAAVNSAIQWYRGQGIEIHELLANIAGLQEVIADLYAEKSTPPRGGIWARLARIWRQRN